MARGTAITASADRTKLLLIGGGLLIVLAVVLGVAIGVPLSRRSSGGGGVAEEVLKAYPLVDGHNDFPWQLYLHEKNKIIGLNLHEDLRLRWPIGDIPSMTDIPRLREGGIGAQFWAAYVSCDTQYHDAVRATLEQIDVIHRFVEANPDTFTFVTTADEILKAFEDGKIGSLIGVEGGHSIDSSLATLRLMYKLGVRYMTLTHNCNTPWADCYKTHESNDTSGISNGLSAFGLIVVKEMNRLGMLVDLSHVSQDTMRDALGVTEAPVIYSHSSAFALCGHFRNVPDDILQLVRDNQGVVMINFYPGYITCNDTYATLEQVVDHIDHIKDVVGVDFVGIGSDFDGVPVMPVGLEDVATYPALLQEMSNRGWTREDMEKVTGRNLIRAMKRAEEVSQEQADREVKPYEDLIPGDLVADNSCRTVGTE